MKRLLTTYFLLIAFISCGPERQNKYLSYQNIVILSDMSSRLDNRPPKDLAEIHKIVEYFKNECVKPGKKIGDKSSISFSVFSQKIAASIDIDTIKNLGAKQRFINSTGEYVNRGLAQMIVTFEQTVAGVYRNTRNSGLDLISILIEKIENESIVKPNKILNNGFDSTFISYENHVYVFTDGYLEYRNKRANGEFYFGNREIEEVRQYCQLNNVSIKKALESNASLCLPLTKSPKNKYLNLHIWETHERDFDVKSQTYRHSKGLRDNEILEAVWRKWAIESGFKNFEWRKY